MKYLLILVALSLLPSMVQAQTIDGAIRQIVREEFLAILDSLQIGPGSPPPGPGGPTGPVEPPPTPPPALPPSESLAGGSLILEGFWSGWQVRHPERFLDHGSYGGMATNTQGVLYLGTEHEDQGHLTFEVRFPGGFQLCVPATACPGSHLFGLSTFPLALVQSRYMPGAAVWASRIDLAQPESEHLQIVATWWGEEGQNAGDQGKWIETSFPIGEWVSMDISWQMESDRMLVSVNGRVRSFSVPSPEQRGPGVYLVAGNYDGITGEILFRNIRLGD